MTNLKCSVNSCAHYESGCCCKPEIKIDGMGASNCAQTCCNSYQERTAQSTNSVGYSSPNPSLEVNCSATSCVHNCNQKCDADCVCVNCCTNQGTECSSFRKA